MKRIFVILFLLSVPVVVFILLFSGPHMKNNPSFRKFEAVYNLPPEDAVPLVEVDSIHVIPSISAGKVYYDYYCVFCHGSDGKGNGPVGQSYVPKPADLTDSVIKTYDTTALYQAAFTGVGHSPVLERVVPAEWRDDIIAYLKIEFIKSK